MKKRITAALLALVMALALAACGGGAGSAPAASAPAASTPAASEPAGSAPAGDSLMFRINMPEASTDNKAVAIQQVVENIEKRTEGRVTFEVYYSGELGNFTDNIESIAMGSNIIDGTSGDAYAPYGCADMTALNLMGLYPDPESVAAFNGSDLFKQMCDELEANSGIKMICMNWAGAPREVLCTSPINSISDLEGKMIRVPLPPYVAFFKWLGCSTVNMTMAEVYTGMQQGMLDACEFPLGTIYTNSLQEVAKYCYLSSHTFAPTCWGMSADLFNQMSAEDQAIFVEEFSKGGEFFSQLNVDNMADFRQKLEEAGVTFVEPSAEDRAVMDAAAAEAVEDFPELSEGIVDKVRAAMGQ